MTCSREMGEAARPKKPMQVRTATFGNAVGAVLDIPREHHFSTIETRDLSEKVHLNLSQDVKDALGMP